MREEGMEAWVELPMWAPSDDPAKQQLIAREVESIVRQYRYHDNIVLWTAGCEWGPSVSADFRAQITRTLKNLSSGALVKDSSGGADFSGDDLS